MTVYKTFGTVRIILFGVFCLKRKGKMHFQAKLFKMPREKLEEYKGIKLIFLE